MIVIDPVSGAVPVAEQEPDARRPGPVLAIDIGGTKPAAALVDAEGSVLRRAEAPTPVARPEDEAAVAQALIQLAEEVCGELLLGPLRAHLRRRACLDFVKRVRAVPGTLGRDAGLIGAARCAQLAGGERHSAQIFATRPARVASRPPLWRGRPLRR